MSEWESLSDIVNEEQQFKKRKNIEEVQDKLNHNNVNFIKMINEINYQTIVNSNLLDEYTQKRILKKDKAMAERIINVMKQLLIGRVYE